MKKLHMGYLGLLGIPLALLGVVTSVALAAPKTVTPVEQSDSTVQSAPAISTDAETNDDSSATAEKADTETAGTPETNDDANGPQEAPGTETAD